MAAKYSGVNIRKTHPALYQSIMTLGVMGIALALNFWFARPTFDPFGIPKPVVAGVFFMLGACQLVFLNVFRDLRKVRLTLAASIAVYIFWGLANGQQWVNGRASLQLPILYVTLAILQMPLLVEAPVNLTTEKE